MTREEWVEQKQEALIEIADRAAELGEQVEALRSAGESGIADYLPLLHELIVLDTTSRAIASTRYREPDPEVQSEPCGDYQAVSAGRAKQCSVCGGFVVACGRCESYHHVGPCEVAVSIREAK